jgi:glycosyltransferase involved in cell wall biosynthesis
MDFSVVIPTYNRLDLLLRVLDALERQEDVPPPEVIVINDGSTDDTERTVSQRKRIVFRSQTNGGPALARNHGVALATGRFVVFLGDDTVPEPRFLAEHARTHREAGGDPLIACLGYTGWPREERVTAFMDYINDYGLQFGYRLIDDGAIVPFNFFYTSNVSVDRLLLAANPFDATFRSAAWEDTELAYRLDMLGLKIRYNARAVTRHHHPMTIDSFAERQYKVGVSGAALYRKHPELADLIGFSALERHRAVGAARLARLRHLARLGERFRLLARKEVFATLMREHYLRGLRAGLASAMIANGGCP